MPIGVSRQQWCSVDVLRGDRGTAEMVLAELYVSDREGNDATGDGTEEKPFKTGLKALMMVGKEPFPTIYVDLQKEKERWGVISTSQMKSIKKMRHREQMKSDLGRRKRQKITYEEKRTWRFFMFI